MDPKDTPMVPANRRWERRSLGPLGKPDLVMNGVAFAALAMMVATMLVAALTRDFRWLRLVQPIT